MDGCSTAMDSHFSSTLIGKLLRKIAVEKGYQELYQDHNAKSLDEELKEILQDLF